MKTSHTPPKKPVNPGYHDLKPTIWVGKQGISDTIIEEIRLQVKVKHLVKVKWLASTDIEPSEIAESSGTVLLQVRGRTMVLGDKSHAPSSRPRNI